MEGYLERGTAEQKMRRRLKSNRGRRLIGSGARVIWSRSGGASGRVCLQFLVVVASVSGVRARY